MDMTSLVYANLGAHQMFDKILLGSSAFPNRVINIFVSVNISKAALPSPTTTKLRVIDISYGKFSLHDMLGDTTINSRGEPTVVHNAYWMSIYEVLEMSCDDNKVDSWL